jgi:hypothetical protein
MSFRGGRRGPHPAGEPDQLAAGPSGRVRAQPHSLGHELPGLLLALARAIPAMEGFPPRMHGQTQLGPAQRLGNGLEMPMERRLFIEAAGIKLDHQPAPGPGVIERAVSESPIESAPACAGHWTRDHQTAPVGLSPARPAPGPSRAGMPRGDAKPFRIGQQSIEPLHRALLRRLHRAAMKQIHQPAHAVAFGCRHHGRPVPGLRFWPALPAGGPPGSLLLQVRRILGNRRLPRDLP